jgi:hypothetical protein
MPLSVSAFSARFPEFSATPTTRIAAEIASAEARVDASIPAKFRDELILFEVADQLSASTSGRNARRAKNAAGDKGSIYSERLRHYRALAVAGVRTSGA